MRPSRLLPALVVAGALLFAGCGSDDGDGAFDASVAEVRAAVADGDADRATDALDGLALHALAAHEDGTIDDDELSEVAELIESSKSLVDDIVPTTSTSTTSTTTTTTVVFEGDDGDDEDDDGEGRGKDRKKDDD